MLSVLFVYYLFAHWHKTACFKYCTKQGMTATASNWSQRWSVGWLDSSLDCNYASNIYTYFPIAKLEAQ